MNETTGAPQDGRPKNNRPFHARKESSARIPHKTGSHATTSSSPNRHSGSTASRTHHSSNQAVNKGSRGSY